MQSYCTLLLSVFLASPMSVLAAISVSGPTTGWLAVQYADAPSADASGDQQKGSAEGDIVGDAANPSFYTAFDDGGTVSLADDVIGFRVRLAADANPAGSKTVVWFGIDANMDGTMDLFAGAIEDDQIGLYAVGAGANVSPGTTSIQHGTPLYSAPASTSNFSFLPVTPTIDPGHEHESGWRLGRSESDGPFRDDDPAFPDFGR
ncbi:hypothetical protein OVA24_04195 [Luteolibacter sp. SL250]|uniref:hypothetical protein n=1 Tax=Luteolibacter sp. SL250 TaxID=2995170 RepID=UPI0022703817|nr:hypothetical protein [Luteolibacter sp. SL250]WAC20578.1 hypothetical protein OVA24_04195 [Luteolibacter sp. SL250]